jgi:hypothetical protein
LFKRDRKQERTGEEVGGRRDEGGSSRILALEDTVLGDEEDDASESSSDGGSEDETSEDGTETFSVVPTPLDGIFSTDGDSDTGESGDDGVGRRDGPRVL